MKECKMGEVVKYKGVKLIPKLQGGRKCKAHCMKCYFFNKNCNKIPISCFVDHNNEYGKYILSVVWVRYYWFNALIDKIKKLWGKEKI